MKENHDYRVVDENFDLPPAIAHGINLVCYAAMVLPFSMIIGAFLLGRWGVTVLVGYLGETFPSGVHVFPVIGLGVESILILLTGWILFGMSALYPPCASYLITKFREELRRELRL